VDSTSRSAAASVATQVVQPSSTARALATARLAVGHAGQRRRPAGELIRPSEYDVAPIASVARELVMRHHYAVSASSTAYRFGLYLRGDLVGVALFGPPPSMAAHRAVFPTLSIREAVTLGRLVVMWQADEQRIWLDWKIAFRPADRAITSHATSYGRRNMKVSAHVMMIFLGIACQPRETRPLGAPVSEVEQAATVPRNVSEYATGGDGSAGSPWIGWDSATPWSDGMTFWFPSGVYQHSSTLLLRSKNVIYRGEAGTMLKHTGSADAVKIDGTTGGPGYMFNVIFENFTIQGNANTANGLMVHNASHIVLRNVRVKGATESAFRALFVILGVFDNLVVSGNEDALNPQPKYGITLSCDWNWNNCLERPTNAVTIINPIIEGASEIGILFQEAEYNTVIGGTSEGNATGIYIGQGLRPARGARDQISRTGRAS
jgi:hypothetical protein